jgi:6-phosphogluconolactonase (cycloisomerase 2 family)
MRSCVHTIVRLAALAVLPACIVVPAQPAPVAPQPQPLVLASPPQPGPIVQASTSARERIYFAVPGIGVSAFAIDIASGRLTELAGARTTETVPMALAADPTGEHLFVGHNNLAVAVNSFALDERGAPGPEVDTGLRCGLIYHLVFDPSGRHSYYSCGVDQIGMAIVATTASDGTLTPLPSGPTPIDSQQHNPPALAVEPRGRFLYAAGTGAHAQLVRYALGADGAPTDPSVEDTAFVFTDLVADRTGRFLYVSASSELRAYAIDPATGHLKRTATLTMIGYHVVLHPNGRFLYGSSNGGHIAAVALDPATGKPSPLADVAGPNQQAATTGALAIDPSGKYLYEADLDTNVYAFAIAPDGHLTSLGSVAKLPAFAEAALTL